MNQLICIAVALLLICLPVSAAEVTEVPTVAEVTEAETVPAPTELVPITDIPEDVPAALLVTGSLSGGYYFVADCALGEDLKFYVPLEWAHDVFALDSSGAPVNMSNSTCYAYCEDFPDYTFSCSRFGAFTYRSSSYSTTELLVSGISDTNISFLEDESVHLSDSEMLVVIAAMVFIFGCCAVILRR